MILRAIRLMLDGFDAKAEALDGAWREAMAQAKAHNLAGWEWQPVAKDGTAQEPGFICAGCTAALGVRQSEYMLSQAVRVGVGDARLSSMRCSFQARHPTQAMILPGPM